MSTRNVPLFTPSGLGTPFLRGQLWRLGWQQPFQANAILTDGGLPTKYFRDWWNAAFPARDPLPMAPIANPDGTGTAKFWDLLA